MNSKLTHYNSLLAAYFTAEPLYLDGSIQKKPNARKLVELPWQQTKARLWDGVTDTLCNLGFIQAKACAKMTYDLVKDFNVVLKEIPDNADNIREENEHQARMDKYTRDLIAYARGEIKELEVPETVPLWTEEKINGEIVRMKTNPNRLDRLKDFKNFLGQEAGNLQNYSYEFPHFATQQAWNYADYGPVGNIATNSATQSLKYLLQYTPPTRPNWNPFPQIKFLLKGHNDFVISIAITPDCKTAISGSCDKTCIIWNLVTGESKFTLIGHTDSVNVVAVTPDSKRAISGSRDSTCIVWDLNTGRAINILKGHTESINAIALSADGEKAITGSDDKTCIIWDLNIGRNICVMKGFTATIRAVAFMYDSKNAISIDQNETCIIWDIETAQPKTTLSGQSTRNNFVFITPDGKMAISCTKDKTFTIWNLTTGVSVKIKKQHFSFFERLAITPDGRRAITSYTKDKDCLVWDLISWQTIRILEGHIDDVTAVAISPDGKTAISGSKDNSCILWNLDYIQEKSTFYGYLEYKNTVAITPTGRIAISGAVDYSCIVWDLNSGRKINTLEGHTTEICCASISYDGKLAITGSDFECIVWDLLTSSSIYVLERHTDTISAVAITSDGKKAITGSYDKTCILWDLRTGEEEFTLKGHSSDVNAVALTPDGKTAISGSNDYNCIIWNLETGQVIYTLKGHTASIWSVAITPDGKRAISGSKDGKCIIWDLITGQSIKVLTLSSVPCNVAISSDYKKVITCNVNSICKIWNLETGKTDIINEGEYLSAAKAVLITPDNRYAIYTDRKHSCTKWDMNTGMQINKKDKHLSPINHICISPDGKKAISGSGYDWDKSHDNSCIFWDLTTGRAINSTRESSPVNDIAIIFDSTIAVYCTDCEDFTYIGKCFIWDLEKGEEKYSKREHTGGISSVVVTPDGKRAISSSQDKTSIVWDLNTKQTIFVLKGHTERVNDVIIAPDGKIAISISEDKKSLIWDLNTGQTIKTKNKVETTAITPDGKIIIGAINNTIIKYDLFTGTEIARLNIGAFSVNNFYLSSDGKRAFSIDGDTCFSWNIRNGKLLHVLTGQKSIKNIHAITYNCDLVLILKDDKTCILWDLNSGIKISVFVATTYIRLLSFFPSGIIGGESSGRIVILKVNDELLLSYPSIVTIKKIWDFGLQQYLPPSADCPLCGHRFTPAVSVLGTIETIIKKAGLKPEQSPCMELPDEAWEHPGLLGNCPNCGGELKFNPFIAGEYKSESMWKFWKR